MRLGETIATYDIGLALRGKSGKFEVTSPSGDIYDVTCKPNYSSSNPESSDGTDHPPFLIRKVAERASPVETTAATREMLEEVSQTESSPRPFVVEPASDDERSSEPGKIELLYLDDDPETGRPSACIYLKREQRDHALEAETLMTSRCATFNELDSEIRRLQAQLDEIHSRAKKMFYKAQTIAASA
jgi:hypothetical protein